MVSAAPGLLKLPSHNNHCGGRGRAKCRVLGATQELKHPWSGALALYFNEVPLLLLLFIYLCMYLFFALLANTAQFKFLLSVTFSDKKLKIFWSYSTEDKHF